MRALSYYLIFTITSLSINTVSADAIYISNARIHTAADAGLIENGDILIRDGKIAAVGQQLATPDDVTLIDAKGKQITPGLFNPYTQIGISEISLVSATVDGATKDKKYSASFDIASAINPRSTVIPFNRIHGLSHSIVVPGSGHHLFAGQGAAIQLDDTDSLIIKDKVAVFANFGSGASAFAGGSRAAAYMKIRQAFLDAKEYDRHRKAVRAGDWRKLSLPLHDLEALLPLLKSNKPFVVTVERASDITMLLRLKQEFGLNLIIAGASEAWMVAGHLAEENVPVIMNPMANLPLSFERLAARLDSARRLHAAGVKLIFSQISFIGITHNAYLIRQAAGNAVAYGLPKHAAIRAITLNPAQAFGLDEQIGSLEVGKQANLVIWDGDPFELLTRAEQVIIDGKLMPMVSRASRLRERYRDLESVPDFLYRK